MSLIQPSAPLVVFGGNGILVLEILGNLSPIAKDIEWHALQGQFIHIGGFHQGRLDRGGGGSKISQFSGQTVLEMRTKGEGDGLKSQKSCGRT